MLTEHFLHLTKQKYQSFPKKNQMKPVLEHNAICRMSPLYLIINMFCSTCYEIRTKTLIRDMVPALRELRIQRVFMPY